MSLALAALGAAGCTVVSGPVRVHHPALTSEVGQSALRQRAPAVLMWEHGAPDDPPEARAWRERIARTAGAHVGETAVVVHGERFRPDCSGVVRGIYAQAGVPLGSVVLGPNVNDTRALYEWMKRAGSLRRSNPLPGDLVFFSDTWDQNGNGLRDDPLSHVGIVERVHDDGRVVLVHRVGDRIVRASMTLSQPHARASADGRPLNHFLRTAEGGEPAKTTAELFVAFGSAPLTAPPRLAAR